MKTLVLEVRDRATFLPVVAIDMNPDGESWYDSFAKQRFLLRRAGYVCDGRPIILLTRLHGGPSHYDPYDWGDRTMKVAHNYIEENWITLSDGDVIDVEFILGETAEPKRSEEVTTGV